MQGRALPAAYTVCNCQGGGGQPGVKLMTTSPLTSLEGNMANKFIYTQNDFGGK